MKKALPWIALGGFALWIVAALRIPPDQSQAWAVRDFGRLPVVSNGRFQPIDSLARNSLLQLREKQSIHLKEEKRELSATEWLMEVMMNSEIANARRTFRYPPRTPRPGSCTTSLREGTCGCVNH